MSSFSKLSAIKPFRLFVSPKLYLEMILLISTDSQRFLDNKQSLILCAIWRIISVGTASPMHCRMFISWALYSSFFSLSVKQFNSASVCSIHLKLQGTVIISINSLILKTRSCSGWIVFCAASWSFLVWTHWINLSQGCLVYLSLFFLMFSLYYRIIQNNASVFWELGLADETLIVCQVLFFL